MWLLFRLRCVVICPGYVACDNQVQKVILFVCIAAEEFTGRVHSLPFVVFCQYSWDPSCAHLLILQLFRQNPINGGLRDLRNRNAEIIQRDPSIFTHGFLKLWDRLVASWWSPTLFFVVNFSETKCKLPTPLSDVFDIHARLSIHFSQLMNFNQCVAFCVQKPNNCANFALCSIAQWELNHKRLLRLSIQFLHAHAWMEWGKKTHAAVLPRAAKTVPRRFGDLTFGIDTIK